MNGFFRGDCLVGEAFHLLLAWNREWPPRLAACTTSHFLSPQSLTPTARDDGYAFCRVPGKSSQERPWRVQTGSQSSQEPCRGGHWPTQCADSKEGAHVKKMTSTVCPPPRPTKETNRSLQPATVCDVVSKETSQPVARNVRGGCRLNRSLSISEPRVIATCGARSPTRGLPVDKIR